MKLSTDAVLLGAFVHDGGAGSILDIGSGSGIIALMLAQRTAARITALEPHAGSAADARSNFENSPWTSRLDLVEMRVQDFAASHLIKFDQIVSNPPFFNNSLPSPYHDRTLSKHTQSLTFEDLLSAVQKLLEPAGAFSVIIPATDEEGFRSQALAYGLVEHRRLIVYPKRSKPANRILIEYNLTDTQRFEESTLVIRTENNDFTNDYRLFTKDFYLHF